MDQETICATALKAIFDILIVFGLESFCDTSKGFSESDDDEIFDESDDEKKSNETAKHVTSILTSLLDSEVRRQILGVLAKGNQRLIAYHFPNFFSKRKSARLLPKVSESFCCSAVYTRPSFSRD